MSDSFSTEIELAAAPDLVFDHFVRPDLMVRWMGDTARLHTVWGGSFAVDINGAQVRGTYVRIETPLRIEIAWGEEGNADMPPGSTQLSVAFEPIPIGTRLRLVHTGLVPAEAVKHTAAWRHYLARLTELVIGHDPGPDPWARTPPDQRRG